MEMLKNALKNLAVLESRVHELVDAPTAIANGVRDVAVLTAAEVQKFDARLVSLEGRVKQLEALVGVPTTGTESAPPAESGNHADKPAPQGEGAREPWRA